MSGWRHPSVGDSADWMRSTLSAASRRVSKCQQLITRPEWSAINCADTGQGITDSWPRTCRILNTTFMTFSRQLARGDSGALLPLLFVCEINHPISTWNFVPNVPIASRRSNDHTLYYLVKFEALECRDATAPPNVLTSKNRQMIYCVTVVSPGQGCQARTGWGWSSLTLVIVSYCNSAA